MASRSQPTLIALQGRSVTVMLLILFLVLFFGLLAVGMPIFLVLGLCAAVLYFASGEPLIGVAQVIIDHLNSPTLMSLPLFVMAATFMRHGGVAKALVDLSAAWLGGIRGSLGLVTVVACTLFAAISRLVGRDRARDGNDPAAGDDRERLSAQLRARRRRRVRHHRHRDPAVAGADPVRHRRRAVGAAPVPRRRVARPVAGGGVLRLGLVRRAAAEISGRTEPAVRRTACA